MKLGKIFICINLLILSLLMLTGYGLELFIKIPVIGLMNIVLDDGYVLNGGDIVETEDGYDLILHYATIAFPSEDS